MRDSLKNTRVCLRSIDSRLMCFGRYERGVRLLLRRCVFPRRTGRGNPCYLGANHDQDGKFLQKEEETTGVFWENRANNYSGVLIECFLIQKLLCFCFYLGKCLSCKIDLKAEVY